LDIPPEREARILWDNCKDSMHNEETRGSTREALSSNRHYSCYRGALGRPKVPITAEESGVIEDVSERFSIGSEDVGDANRERLYRKYLS